MLSSGLRLLRLPSSLPLRSSGSSSPFSSTTQSPADLLKSLLPHLTGPVCVITSESIPLHSVLSHSPTLDQDEASVNKLKAIVSGCTQLKNLKINYLSTNPYSSVLNPSTSKFLPMHLSDSQYTPTLNTQITRTHGTSKPTCILHGPPSTYSKLIRYVHSLKGKFSDIVLTENWPDNDDYWHLNTYEHGDDLRPELKVDYEDKNVFTGRIINLSTEKPWSPYLEEYFDKPISDFTASDFQVCQLISIISQSNNLMKLGVPEEDIWKDLKDEESEVFRLCEEEVIELEQNVVVLDSWNYIKSKFLHN
ncbi:hypothetical protein TL16_g12066 [Triparma laevis f. inornata]|uniref:Uncharacterized protein n=2 Tax=Triparma laevis TaxID=1534972 RepID=A0A9W7AWJ3_9STRA|nr:hypothetical protein TrLO_g1219 [Triparma laevis f. longispina]GMH91457.1 hypothetical protein TL16_g12066 [Triparma laevis f. inornata]